MAPAGLARRGRSRGATSRAGGRRPGGRGRSGAAARGGSTRRRSAARWGETRGAAAAVGLPQSFKSFCIEGQQSVSPGWNSFDSLVPLAASKLLGPGRAELVAEFWRQYGPTASTGFADNTDGAAFQLGIWELINDGRPATGQAAKALVDGTFKVAGTHLTAPAVARAAAWLNGSGTSTGGRGAVALYALQSPTKQDQVVCVPTVDLDVTPSAVTEDGRQGLTYTFSRAVATSTPLTVNYVLGGSATQANDFTGLPAGSGTRSITIPAGATTASLTVLPTPDSEIEFDETVVLTLLPGAGYALGSNTVATGTIENDDYLLDLVLDGLPEETAPGPNELSPGAVLPIGGGRKRLDLIVESPGYAGMIALFVTTRADGADAVTLWDSEEGGKQVQPATWPVGQQPRTLWVETTGVEADIQFIAMFQNKGAIKQDAAKAVAVASRPDITFDPKDIAARVSSWMNGLKNRLEDQDTDTLNLGVNGIRVDHAIGTFRSIKVVTKAIDDQAIGRDNAESFYFKGKQTTSGWNILRGVDHNPGDPYAWLRDYHPDVGVCTPKDFSALPTDEQNKWTEEYERWLDPRVTAQRMTGTLDVTYVYAGKLDPGTAWVPARKNFDLAAGDPTPPGSPYPYKRPLNVAASKWLQDFPHLAEKPDGWDFVSTLTLHFEFTIDLENDRASVTGTWAIDDIGGMSNGVINVKPGVN